MSASRPKLARACAISNDAYVFSAVQSQIVRAVTVMTSACEERDKALLVAAATQQTSADDAERRREQLVLLQSDLAQARAKVGVPACVRAFACTFMGARVIASVSEHSLVYPVLFGLA